MRAPEPGTARPSWRVGPEDVRRLVATRARQFDAGAVALAALAIAAFVVSASPVVDRVAFLGLVVLAAASTCLAVWSAPRGDRLVPALIAVGVSLGAFVEVLWQTLDALGVSPAVPVDHPPRLASYVALCVAMWVVVVRARPSLRTETTFVIDAATVVAVSVMVLWSISYGSTVGENDAPAYVRLVLLTYPVSDALLLALLVRVLLSSRARSTVEPAFAVGVGLWLAADVGYLLDPSGHSQVLMQVAWMLAPAMLSRAAWHWRPTEATGPEERSPRAWMVGLAIAVVPMFVPPALEVASVMRGEQHRPFLLATGSVALVALAFVRTARLMRTEERARRELEQARDEAMAASRAKSVFVATMSHEIRTPLTTVLASAEMLEDVGLDDDQQALQRRMRRSAGQLHTLVEDILDFSRIEAGHLELTTSVFDLQALVAELSDAYRVRAADAGLDFEGWIDPTLPRAVEGDPGRLLQVAGNLLDNALKFTEHGWVALDVRRPAGAGVHPEPEAPGSEVTVEVVVTDSGIGIAPERLERVFGAFEQADGSSTRRHGGSGLGLAICRELAALMGGTITASSETGRGSQFVATVRLRVAAAPTDGTVGVTAGPVAMSA